MTEVTSGTTKQFLQRIEELERQNEDLEVVVDNLKTAEGNLWERAKRTDKRLAAAERVVELARDTFIPYKNKRDQFEELIAAYDAVVGGK
jgi:chromosome segregation ATPase